MTTAALTLSLAGIAVVHRSADGTGSASTDNLVSTSAGPARLACPPVPRLQATSRDRQFSAGRGVGWSRTVTSALGSTSPLLEAGSMPVDTSSQTPGTPTRTSATARPTAATPTSDATEVPRPSGGSTTAPTVSLPGLKRIGSTGALWASRSTASVPRLFSAQPRGDVQPLVGGLTVASSTTGDLRGLAMAACAAPSENIWLVGGRAGAGSGSRVVVSNPSDVSATVNLKLLTPAGTLTPPVGTGLVVAPRSTREVLLRSLTQQQSVLAVGVAATGSAVSAFLVDQRVTGTNPAGVDVVSDTPPARRQVLQGRVGPKESAMLRLAVPGRTEATITYRTEQADGTFSRPRAITVNGGRTEELQLPDNPAGPSRVVVEADQPVVAGMELTRSSGAIADRAWVGGSQPLSGPVLVPLPAVPATAQALLLSTGPAAGADGTPVTLQRYDAKGTRLPDITLTVPATGLLTVPAAALNGAVAVILRPTEPIHASLTLIGAGADRKPTMITTMAIPPAAGTRVDAVVQHAGPGDWP